MGIPNLYTLLRPYAHPMVFPTSESTTAESTAAPEYPAEVQPHLYIDGPALAYHIYNTSLAENYYDNLGRVRRNPFDAVIEYDQFVGGIGQFLEKLEGVGFSIQAIFFDGYLPPAKYPTRLERLNTSLSKLISYHSLHPHHIPTFTSAYRQASCTQPISNSKLQSLPSPPFIVSTALSYLTSSKWSLLVEAVPGEADAWCASAAIRGSGWAMSGDTDLLLYGHGREVTGSGDQEMGQWGVVMFRDFHFLEGKRVDGTVHWLAKALVFWPKVLNRMLFGGEDSGAVSGAYPPPQQVKRSKKNPVRKRRKLKSEFTSPTIIASSFLGTSQITPRLPSLQNLAYHLQNEPTASMNRLKQMVKSSLSLHDMSQREKEFISEYSLVRVPPQSMGVQGKESSNYGLQTDIQLKIRQLDPRFSELLYQLPCFVAHVHPPYNVYTSAKAMGKKSKAGWVEVNSFLPFLYEDPTRSGAWDVGREMRATVYSILEAYQNESDRSKQDGGQRVNLVVNEYVRKGRRIREVTLESGEDWGMGEQNGLLSSILSPGLLNFVVAWRTARDRFVLNRAKSQDCCECIDFWWVEMVVEMVLRDYAERRKEMPVRSEVGMIVHMLSQAVAGRGGSGSVELFAEKHELGPSLNPKSQSLKTPLPCWTWSIIHLFAQVQAAVYSLWMLKQFIVFAVALGHLISEEDHQNIVELAAMIDRVPPMEKVIAAKRFLGVSSDQPDKMSCEICGFGETTIINTLVKRWNTLRQSPEGVEDGIGIKTGEYGGEDGNVNEEEDEVGEKREIWSGMKVDF